MNIKEFYLKNKKIVDSILISAIPTIVTTVLLQIVNKESNLLRNIFITLFAYGFMAAIVFLFRNLFFRNFKKYEGKWIEYIPNFSRQFSICELKYKGGEYHFTGTNYDNNCFADYVNFYSFDFICSSEDTFTYSTKSTLISNFEGFGKVFGFTGNATGFLVAKGYFVDITDNSNPKIQHTRMVKWDENFFSREDIKQILPKNKLAKDLTDMEIINSLRNYIPSLFQGELS